jgi:type II secretory ATPase GspE/PulE/Tfp pilus assembly ATPase PilB-like protein
VSIRLSRTIPSDGWLLPLLAPALSAEQRAQLLASPGTSVWSTAVRRGFLTDAAILELLAARFQVALADVDAATPAACAEVPEALARRYGVLPLSVSESALHVASADPRDLDAERALAFAMGRSIRVSLAAPTRIRERLDEFYRPADVIEKLLANVTGRYSVETLSEAPPGESPAELETHRSMERPVIQLVDRIIAEAIHSRASDVHLEPEEANIAVRYRIDGVLRRAMVLPRVAGLPLVSRVKIMAQLDIADRLRPQDGRARVSVNGHRVDLRISTLPSAGGEKVVVRILDQRATALALDALGFVPSELTRVQQLLDAREGLLLVTGPTGSGKTTTLYAMLKLLQQRGLNIVSVEDPVEYRVAGIVQVQVNEKAGLTFPAALRSILRQDPDVVLIGEIRDRETAAIALQAALTGHLVLSTLHTNDAISAVPRLLDLGVERFKLAGALRGVIAQRLLRRLCPRCRSRTVAPVPSLAARWFAASAPRFSAVGCPGCAQTGYRGRLCASEVVVNGPELGRLIGDGASAGALADAADREGLRALWFAGVQHAAEGLTSVEELVRVLTPPTPPPVRYADVTKPSMLPRPALILGTSTPVHAEVRAVLERYGYSWRAEPPVAPPAPPTATRQRAPDS